MFMKKMFVRLTVVALCLLTATGTFAGNRELSRQESDSVSHALATLWGDYVRNKAKNDGGAVSAEYMRGLKEALKMAEADDAYFQGLEEGVLIAQRLRQVEQLGGFKVDIPKVAYVIERIQKGRPSGFNTASAENYMNNLMTLIAHERMLVEGSKGYLEEASKKEGVMKLPSGLLFEVITEGEGSSTPGPEDAVLVNYKGYLIDGSIFNETPKTEQGTVFLVNETIPGFREGLQMMKKGGKYRIYIPSELGYGENGVDGLIPGGAATYFEVEMIDFQSKAGADADQQKK